MRDDFFSGKWTGRYSYGAEYIGIPPVPFELDMTVLNGNVQGECRDDETKHHFDRPATIEGTLQDNQITFIKKYPWFWDHDQHNKPRFFPKLPAREVRYTGRFENGKFTGEWLISSLYTDESGQVLEYRGTGTWEMTKVM
jgi:hypothetical protein